MYRFVSLSSSPKQHSRAVYMAFTLYSVCPGRHGHLAYCSGSWSAWVQCLAPCCCRPWKAAVTVQVTGFLLPTWLIRTVFSAPGLGPGNCGHLRSEPVDGNSLKKIHQ